MSKAILVIDMPKMCGECVLRMAMICAPTMKDIDSVNTKMNWWSLQNPPDKEEGSDCFDEFEDGYAQGWNDCIEEIFR